MAAAGGAWRPGVEPGPAPPLPALGGVRPWPRPAPPCVADPCQPAAPPGPRVPGCGSPETRLLVCGGGRSWLRTWTRERPCPGSNPSPATSLQRGHAAQPRLRCFPLNGGDTSLRKGLEQGPAPNAAMHACISSYLSATQPWSGSSLRRDRQVLATLPNPQQHNPGHSAWRADHIPCSLMTPPSGGLRQPPKPRALFLPPVTPLLLMSTSRDAAPALRGLQLSSFSEV